jgi:prevent-host-death family protein
MVIMKKVSVAELKARLSEYLGIVKSGEDVIVTEHGRPVARLVPLTGELAQEARMAELIRTGAVRPPQADVTDEFLERLRKLRESMPAGGDIVAEMRAERDEGW